MGIIRRIDMSGDMTITLEEWRQFFTPSWEEPSVRASMHERASPLYRPKLMIRTPPTQNGGSRMERANTKNHSTAFARKDSYTRDSADQSPISINGSFIYNSNKNFEQNVTNKSNGRLSRNDAASPLRPKLATNPTLPRLPSTRAGHQSVGRESRPDVKLQNLAPYEPREYATQSLAKPYSKPSSYRPSKPPSSNQQRTDNF